MDNDHFEFKYTNNIECLYGIRRHDTTDKLLLDDNDLPHI